MLMIDTGPTSAGDPVLDTAGGWRGLLDADALKEAICGDRLLLPPSPAGSSSSDLPA
jgi:hypothetical protein